jgi:hypothetical protein
MPKAWRLWKWGSVGGIIGHSRGAGVGVDEIREDNNEVGAN